MQRETQMLTPVSVKKRRIRPTNVITILIWRIRMLNDNYTHKNEVIKWGSDAVLFLLDIQNNSKAEPFIFFFIGLASAAN